MPSKVKDSTDQSLIVFIPDSSSTTGAGLTGLAYNTGSLTCYFKRGATGAATALSLATQTATGAHSDGGFVAIDGTNAPGVYRLDLSDAMVATGADFVTVHLKGAANMVPVTVLVDLVDQIAVDTSGRVRSQDEVYLRGTFTGTPSTTAAETSTAAIQAYANDYFNTNWEIMVCDGPAQGERKTITDFVTGSGGGTGFTFGAMQTAPVSGNTFILTKKQA